eukprot:Opistho-1_new@27348
MNHGITLWTHQVAREWAHQPANTLMARLGSRYCRATAGGTDTTERAQGGKKTGRSGGPHCRRAPSAPGGRQGAGTMPAMPTPLFECQHLIKRFGGHTVVNDLCFDIVPGECLGVIGPNGAGKTTTIRMCLGLTTPDAGSITAFGQDMPRDALAIKARLGVVSQMDTLDPDFSCAENLLVYGRYFGLPAPCTLR